MPTGPRNALHISKKYEHNHPYLWNKVSVTPTSNMSVNEADPPLFEKDVNLSVLHYLNTPCSSMDVFVWLIHQLEVGGGVLCFPHSSINIPSPLKISNTDPDYHLQSIWATVLVRVNGGNSLVTKCVGILSLSSSDLFIFRYKRERGMEGEREREK